LLRQDITLIFNTHFSIFVYFILLRYYIIFNTYLSIKQLTKSVGFVKILWKNIIYLI